MPPWISYSSYVPDANVVFVREQRWDTYYRNDPKKYGLSKPRWFQSIYLKRILIQLWDKMSVRTYQAFLCLLPWWSAAMRSCYRKSCDFDCGKQVTAKAITKSPREIFCRSRGRLFIDLMKLKKYASFALSGRNLWVHTYGREWARFDFLETTYVNC